MTITINIDNPDLEQRLIEIVKQQKQDLEEVTIEALNNFIDMFNQKKKFDFKKKDPTKCSRIINRKYNESDVQDVALLHIKDSAKYIHNLRREKN
jgi:hypothetical protein